MNLSKFQETMKTLQRKRSRMLAIQELSQIAKLDVGREIRKGLPEIILAEGKEPSDVAKIANSMVERSGRAVISRVSNAHLKRIRSTIRNGYRVEFMPRSRIVIVRSPKHRVRPSGGRVGLLTAGTSDIPVAEEAEVVAKEMGCETQFFYDVGVAGLHRLFEPLRKLLEWNADAIIVAAGREGALPTVVAGLVDVPVVGLPTSRSYGFGEKGLAALAAMLQSCSLGMAVVNIDGGVGAGAVAAMIANRMGEARGKGC